MNMRLSVSCLLVLLAVTAHAANIHSRAAGTNVAQGKKASQSSIWSVTNPASYAVDGDTSSTFRIGGHCAQTGLEDNPWVMVDLGDSYVINSVELWTREKNMGDAYAQRDRDMEIRIGDSPYHMNNPVCTKFNGLVPQKAEANCAKPLCGRYISVQRMSAGMNYMHVCEIKAFSLDNKPGCVNEDALTGTCSCTGDPHCNSFDGSWLHYQGACIYTLAQDGCVDGLPDDKPTWSVTANFDRRGGSVSYTKQVTVNIFKKDLEIQLLEDKVVLINGKKALGSPVEVDGAVISITPNQVFVTVEDGVRVRWDGVNNVYIDARESMKGSTCGICGNFDGDKDNDKVIGPSDICMEAYEDAEPGKQSTDTNLVGASWTAAIDQNEDACIAECPVKPPVPPNCPTGDVNKAEEHCNVLRDTSGPFKDCLAKMDEIQKKDLFDNCVYDSCMLNDYENVVCDHATGMSMICNAWYEVAVEYRSSSLCPITCGENMEYRACGTACVPTCSDLEGEKCGDLGACTEGCFCKEGYVFDNDGKCIKQEQCGCLVKDQGVYIQVGESFHTDDCTETCTCEEPQGELKCVKKTCPTNTVCGQSEGEPTCLCLPPFVEVDGKCVEYLNPCTKEGGNDEDEKVQCLTCKNAASLEECEEEGQMETCEGKNAICALQVTKSAIFQVKKVNRMCASRDECGDEMIGPDAEHCIEKDGKFECINCGYGPMDVDEEDNPVYSCYTEPKVNVDQCKLPKPKGTGSKTRWFFKQKNCKCVKFSYTETADENNFASKEECEKTCTTFEIPAECLEPKDPGPCDKFKKYYYFDAAKNKCKKMQYGGCGGNKNLFKKKNDCREMCKRC